MLPWSALLLLLLALVYSCSNAENTGIQEVAAPDSLRRNGPMENPEIPALFPGGNDSLLTWMSARIHYPEAAKADSVQGQVIVSFIVDRFGGLLDVKVEKALHPACDAIALEAIKSMPKWTPAKDSGDDVASRLFLPVDFRIPEEQPNNQELK